jgi:acyl-coenzyme A thioesterase PaaI-like protein
MTFADIAAAGTKDDFGHTTVQMDGQFLRPASLQLPLICECEIRNRGRSLAFFWNASFISGKAVVALASSIWHVRP